MLKIIILATYKDLTLADYLSCSIRSSDVKYHYYVHVTLATQGTKMGGGLSFFTTVNLFLTIFTPPFYSVPCKIGRASAAVIINALKLAYYDTQCFWLPITAQIMPA